MWYFIIGCFFISACTGESLYADVLNSYRVKRENKSSPQQEVEHVQAIKYRPFSEAPERIKKLVILQQTPETIVYWPINPAPIPTQKTQQTQEAAESAPGVHRTPAPEPILQTDPPTTLPPPTTAAPTTAQPEVPTQPSNQPEAQPTSLPEQQSPPQPSPQPSAQPSPQPLYQPLSIPLAQHLPQIETWAWPQTWPAYSPRVEYAEPPKQQAYKGIQAIQAGTQQGPLSLHGQSLSNQETYVPQFKTSYSPQQQQLTLHAAIKAQWNPENKEYQPNLVYRPAENAAPSGWAQAVPQGQFPKNLPTHIRKIIETQRSYQGSPMSPLLQVAYIKRRQANIRNLWL